LLAQRVLQTAQNCAEEAGSNSNGIAKPGKRFQFNPTAKEPTSGATENESYTSAALIGFIEPVLVESAPALHVFAGLSALILEFSLALVSQAEPDFFH